MTENGKEREDTCPDVLWFRAAEAGLSGRIRTDFRGSSAGFSK